METPSLFAGVGSFAGIGPGTRAVVALDIDGTLVDSGDQPSARVCIAIRKLARAGAMIVLATGRQLHGTTPVVAALGIGETWVVASNGAIIARYVGDRRAMVSTQTFDPAPLVQGLLRLDPDVTLGCEDLGVGYLVNRRFGAIIPADHVQRIADEFPAEVTMFSAESATVAGSALAAVAESCGLSAQGWDEFGVGLVDVAAPGLSKGGGVASLVAAAASAADFTLAVGDFHNDIEMLDWADVAVAMGQSPDEVKEIADVIAGSIEEDGVAPVLEALLGALTPPPRR
jgi:hydroxymethylpyrimidine pyrophosphatase-like HAD family hydrolase